MESSRKPRLLTLGTILLVLSASVGLTSAAIFAGFTPGLKYGGIYTHSPTATYQGYFSINFVGVYHYVHAVPTCRTASPPCATPDEALFYMNARNGTIRLIFYCGSAVKYYFCESPSRLPFSDGACVHVSGTFIEPSKWPGDSFSPRMHFKGDLYVFQNETLPQISCS